MVRQPSSTKGRTPTLFFVNRISLMVKHKLVKLGNRGRFRDGLKGVACFKREVKLKPLILMYTFS